MNFGFIGNLPMFKAELKSDSQKTSITTKAVTEEPKEKASNNIKLSGLSFFLSSFPWSNNSRGGFQRPTTINRGLRKHAKNRGLVENAYGIAAVRFRPYVCKVPWHTGMRGFLSQLFPRYGNYCGPNWSSGKDRGSLVWDKRPIDWLDFCCYCHDIGYDTHDQAELLKADLAFLECLEKRNMSSKGNPQIAQLYKTMCITGMAHN